MTRKRKPTPQTPRERMLKGNIRVTAESGKTTWLYKAKPRDKRAYD